MQEQLLKELEQRWSGDETKESFRRDFGHKKRVARGSERSEASYAGMEEDGNKGPRRMGAAKSDVAQRAAPRAQSSEAEVGLSAVSRVDFGCVGTLEDRNFMSSARVPQKKEESLCAPAC